MFALDLGSMRWTRREHGDLAIFPVTTEDYRRHKSPAYGASNPEKVVNPFWLAMAKAGWSPSRVRLHFSDAAPPRPEFEYVDDPAPEPDTPEFAEWMSRFNDRMAREKLARRREREEVIWTAQRRYPGRVTLGDGRRLLIGGRVDDLGDEYADPWTYTDVVVTDLNGEVSVYAYPPTVFPPLRECISHAHADRIVIFGFTDRDLHPQRAAVFATLRLDAGSLEITPLPGPGNSNLNLYPGCDLRRGNAVIFPIWRDTYADPLLGIAFDLETMTWSEPFPYDPPDGTEDE